MAVTPEPGCVVVHLDGVAAMGRHGVLDHERLAEQPFVVDVTLLVPEPGNDDLNQTVDYSRVARLAVRVIESGSVNLIETLAARIGDSCLEIPRVRAVEVCVHKPRAAIPFPYADVSATVYRRAS